MFKRSSLTEQVKSHLKQRIIAAEFEEGVLPSEMQLADELNVSRNTIRDALGRLEMEGIIYRRQGAGTFINQANRLVKTRLEEIVPYETLIREHGYTPAVKLLGVVELSKEEAKVHFGLLAEDLTPSPNLAHQLNLNADDPILIVEKLFLADDNPVIFSRTALPATLLKQPYTAADCKLPIYQFLPEFCRQTPAYFLTDIIPLLAPPWVAEQLHLPQPATALLSFEEVGYNHDHEPLVKATSYFRDDLLRLRLLRRVV